MTEQTPRCELCLRRTKRGTTEHHLIPRCCHSNKWFKKRFTRDQMLRTVSLCHDCHNAIHRFVPKNKDLGRHYNTLKKLLDHDGIQGFVNWIRRQR